MESQSIYATNAEFATDRFGTRLVVVLGHSMCGAVIVTLKELERARERRSPNLRSIVVRIRPSVGGPLETEHPLDRDALMRQAVRANIHAFVKYLRHGSQIVQQLIQRNGLLVVGAEHALQAGIVDFFDDLPVAVLSNP